MKRIAVVGSGISGLVAAYFLGRQYEVTLLERNDYVGGHTNTVEVETGDGYLPIDTGFIVFNDRTYPGFLRLLDHLGIESLPTEMSFSVQCRKTGIEYSGSSLNGLFAQRRNLFRPSFYRFISDFFRFEKAAHRLLEESDESMTVERFFQEHRYSQAFYERYFLPMGAAIWSCPPGLFRQFPIHFIARFYKNHGLLGLHDRPQWRVIRSGSYQYIKAICRRFSQEVRTGWRVSRVQRQRNESSGNIDGVQVQGDGPGGVEFSETFDHVVLACHADQALDLISECGDETERAILKHFPYQSNEAILHTDTSLMPKRRAAWASWNYTVSRMGDNSSTLTYDMNRLQQLTREQARGQQYLVTLNDRSQIRDTAILKTFSYAHPVFGIGRDEAQSKHHQLIGRNGLSYCGAYWGNGFHEDGVQSALRVCEFLLDKDPWTVLSTSVGSRTEGKRPSSINSATVSS